MPILSNFPAGATGGGDASDYATITFHDWDLSPLGSIVVPKGEDASAAVAAFENTLKATTFDEGSQYYSSDKSMPLTNKKGYSFEGVWLDYDDETVTQYGLCVDAGNANNTFTLPTPDGVSFANVSQNMYVKAAYGSNEEIAGSFVSDRYRCYMIETVEYNNLSSAAYRIFLCIKRENAEGEGVPRLRNGILRVCYKTNNITNEAGDVVEYGRNIYNFIHLEPVNEQIVPLYVNNYYDEVEFYAIDGYGVYNLTNGAGSRSMPKTLEKGASGDKTGYAYLGTIRTLNDYLSSNGESGYFLDTATIRRDLGITFSAGPQSKLKERLFSAWRAKNPQWESENHPPFEDLTAEEMQYALNNDGALMPAE